MNSHSFHEYASKMQIHEVGGFSKPGLFGRLTGQNSQENSNRQRIFELALRIANYLGIQINQNEFQRSIVGGDYSGLDPDEKSLVRIAQSIASSKGNGPQIGVNRGQIETLLHTIPVNVLKNHLGSEFDSAEALAVFLGQMAAGTGGHIIFEPGFLKEIEDYYHNRRNQTNKDRKKQGELRRAGIANVAKSMTEMGLQPATVGQIANAMNSVLSKLVSSSNPQDHQDAVQLREFIRGLS